MDWSKASNIKYPGMVPKLPVRLLRTKVTGYYIKGYVASDLVMVTFAESEHP